MAKTATLAGMENPVNIELSRLAESYLATRQERQATLKLEVELKGKLIGEMRNAGLLTYHDEEAGLFVTLSIDEKVTIKVKSGDVEDSE